jgi:ATPase subunit of ABC transporter with duplicated ATPase domains
MDSSEAEDKARKVLLGLGFPPEKIDDSMSKLSGGWRTRCDLACALCQTADILLLDEPTNFLDLPSIIWLQDYLTGPELEGTTVVVVTHDRDFADAVASELLILRNQKLERFRGGVSLYESEKIKKIKWMSTMQESQDKAKKHMEQSITNNIRAAKRTGDDKKLKQAAARQKRLDERMGMEVSAKGHRFKLSRDLAGWHNTLRAAVVVPDFDPLPKLKFPSIPPDLRFPGALVALEKVSFAYTKRGPSILNDVSLTIHLGERYGLAGLNGSGKSTLVNIIYGANAPVMGSVTHHPRVRIAKFSQHVVEELDAIAAAPSRSGTPTTALSHLMEHAPGTSEKDARSVLGSLGLQGSVASDTPLAGLSGGQKVRLAFAKLVHPVPPHLLVLDEVTTHLDGETILALVYALREYEGAVLVVSHDRFFMRCVVEGESPRKGGSRRAGIQGLEEDGSEDEEDEEDEEGGKKGTVFRVFKGSLRLLEGGMGQYEEIAERAAARLSAKKKS